MIMCLDYVWAFALALIITFALTPLVKRFAVAVGAIDKPDARKVHHGAIPRLGGLAIFLGYVGSVLFNGSIPHDHKLFGFGNLVQLFLCSLAFGMILNRLSQRLS